MNLKVIMRKNVISRKRSMSAYLQVIAKGYDNLVTPHTVLGTELKN